MLEILNVGKTEDYDILLKNKKYSYSEKLILK